MSRRFYYIDVVFGAPKILPLMNRVAILSAAEMRRSCYKLIKSLPESSVDPNVYPTYAEHQQIVYPGIFQYANIAVAKQYGTCFFRKINIFAFVWVLRFSFYLFLESAFVLFSISSLMRTVTRICLRRIWDMAECRRFWSANKCTYICCIHRLYSAVHALAHATSTHVHVVLVLQREYVLLMLMLKC